MVAGQPPRVICRQAVDCPFDCSASGDCPCTCGNGVARGRSQKRKPLKRGMGARGGAMGGVGWVGRDVVWCEAGTGVGSGWLAKIADTCDRARTRSLRMILLPARYHRQRPPSSLLLTSVKTSVRSSRLGRMRSVVGAFLKHASQCCGGGRCVSAAEDVVSSVSTRGSGKRPRSLERRVA